MNASKRTSQQRRTRANVVRNVVRGNEKNPWNNKETVLERIKELVVARKPNQWEEIEDFLKFMTNDESNGLDNTDDEENTYCFLFDNIQEEAEEVPEKKAKAAPEELTSIELDLLKMYVHFTPDAGPIGDVRKNFKRRGALQCFLEIFEDCPTLEGEQEKLLFFPFFLWTNGHQNLSLEVFQDMLTNKGRLKNCPLIVHSVEIYLQRNNCLPQSNRPWIPSKDSKGNDIFFWLNKKYVAMFTKLESGRCLYQLLKEEFGGRTPKKAEIEFWATIPLIEEFHHVLYSRISRSNVNAQLWAEWEKEANLLLEKYGPIKCKKCQKPMGVFGAIHAALYWLPVLYKSQSIDVENEACCWDCSSFSDKMYNAKLIKNVLNTESWKPKYLMEQLNEGIAPNVENNSVMEVNLTNDVASSSTDLSSNLNEIVQQEEDCTSDNATEKTQRNNPQIGQPSEKITTPLEHKSARSDLKRKGPTKRRRYSPIEHKRTRKSKRIEDNRISSVNDGPCSSGPSESQTEPIISLIENKNRRMKSGEVHQAKGRKRIFRSEKDSGNQLPVLCKTPVNFDDGSMAGSSNSGYCLDEVKPTQNMKTSTDEEEEEVAEPKDDIEKEKEVQENKSIIPLPNMERSSTSSLTSSVEDVKYDDHEGDLNKEGVNPKKLIGITSVDPPTKVGTQPANGESVVGGDLTKVREEDVEDKSETKSDMPNTASPASLQHPVDSVQSDPVVKEKMNPEHYRLSDSFSNPESLRSVGNTLMKNTSLSPPDVALRIQPTEHLEHQLLLPQILNPEVRVPISKSDEMFSVNTGASSNDAISQDSSNIANQVEDPVKTLKNNSVGENEKKEHATLNDMSSQSSPVYPHESPLLGGQRTFVTHEENGKKLKCFTINYILSIGTSQSNSDVERGANLEFDQGPLSGLHNEIVSDHEAYLGDEDDHQNAADAPCVDPNVLQGSTPSDQFSVSTKKSADGYSLNDTIPGAHDTALKAVRSENDISSFPRTSSHSDSNKDEEEISDNEDAYFDTKSNVDDVPMGDVEPMATETATTKGLTVAITDDVKCSFGKQNTLDETKLIEEPEKEIAKEMQFSEHGSTQKNVDDDADGDDNNDGEDDSDGDDRSLKSVASSGKQSGEGLTPLLCGREIRYDEKESVDRDDEDNLMEESSDDDEIDSIPSVRIQNSGSRDNENEPATDEDELGDDDFIDNAGSVSVQTPGTEGDEKESIDRDDEENIIQESPDDDGIDNTASASTQNPGKRVNENELVNRKDEDELVESPDDVVDNAPSVNIQTPESGGDEKDAVGSGDEKILIGKSPDDVLNNPDCVSMQSPKNTNDEKEPVDSEDKENLIGESLENDVIDNSASVSIQNVESTSTVYGISSPENEADKDSSAVCLGKNEDISSHSSNNQCDDIEEDDEEEKNLEPTKFDESNEKESDIAESSDDERDESDSISDSEEVADEGEEESEERMFDDSYIPGSSIEYLDARTSPVDDIETIKCAGDIPEGHVHGTLKLEQDSSRADIIEINKVMSTSGYTMCGTPVNTCEHIVTRDYDEPFQRCTTNIKEDTYGDLTKAKHSMAERTEDFSPETPEDNRESSDENKNKSKGSFDSPIVSPPVELGNTGQEYRAENPVAFSVDDSKRMNEPEEPESMAIDDTEEQETKPEYNLEIDNVFSSTPGNISSGNSSALLIPSVTIETIVDESDAEASRSKKREESQMMYYEENENQGSTESQYKGNKTNIPAEHQKGESSFQDEKNLETSDPTDFPTTKRVEELTQVQHSITNREDQSLEEYELNQAEKVAQSHRNIAKPDEDESSLWNFGRETTRCLEKYQGDEHDQSCPDEAKDSDAPNLDNMNKGSLFTVKENQSGQLPGISNSAKQNMIDHFSAPRKVSVKNLFEHQHPEKCHLLGAYMEKMEKDVENFMKQAVKDTDVLHYTTIPLTETTEYLKSYNKKDVETLYTKMVMEKEKVYNNLYSYNLSVHQSMEFDLKEDIEAIIAQNLVRDAMLKSFRDKNTEYSKKIEELNSKCCKKIETVRLIWNFRTIGLFGKMTADNNEIFYLSGDKDGLDSSSQTEEIYEKLKINQSYLKTLMEEICEQNGIPFALVLSEEPTKSVQDEATGTFIEPSSLSQQVLPNNDFQRSTSTVTQPKCLDGVSQQQYLIDHFPIADLDQFWLDCDQNRKSTGSSEMPNLYGNSDDMTSMPGWLSGPQQNVWTPTPLVLNRHLPRGSQLNVTPPEILQQNLEFLPHNSTQDGPALQNNAAAVQQQTWTLPTQVPPCHPMNAVPGPAPVANPSQVNSFSRALEHGPVQNFENNMVVMPMQGIPQNPLGPSPLQHAPGFVHNLIVAQHHVFNNSAPNHHGFPPMDQNNMGAHQRSFYDSQPGSSNQTAQLPVNPQLEQQHTNPHFPQQARQYRHDQMGQQQQTLPVHPDHVCRAEVVQGPVLDEQQQRYHQNHQNHQQQLQLQQELQIRHCHHRLHPEQHRQQGNWEQIRREPVGAPVQQVQQSSQVHQWMLQHPANQQQPQRPDATHEHDDEIQIIGERRVQFPPIQLHLHYQNHNQQMMNPQWQLMVQNMDDHLNGFMNPEQVNIKNHT
ncbi:hypothetical protein GCK72_023724 [Caenorhabditis remanei]|uniref:Uncharacterized protein n=1 Tax=Caenorhabditis remanei TaxID=31234 RepID=A0A6A5FXL3_CAERE|nr:hypothetical protein GCK72_023724 [Caenorhabditis remanei]KAF1747262.1 hypothetical protein GCK72_023724 [Caenorhabditis remanei]